MAVINIRFNVDKNTLRGLSAELNNLGRGSTAIVNTIRGTTTTTGISQGLINKAFNIDRNTAARIRNVTTALDQYNNVLRITGQYGIKIRKAPFFEPLADVGLITGNAQKIIEGLLGVAKATDTLATSRARIKKDFKAFNTVISADEATQAKAISNNYTEKIRTSTSTLTSAKAELATVNQTLAQFAARPTIRNLPSQEIRYQASLAQQATLMQQIRSEQARINALRGAETKALVNDPVLQSLQGRRIAYRQLAAEELLAGRAAVTAAQQRTIAAAARLPEIPKNIQTALGISPQLGKILQNAGLATTGLGLEAQQAKFSAPRLDLIRGTTAVSGEFYKNIIDKTGAARQQLVGFSAELDNKTGKVITRFGGTLSGLSGGLRQIGRDFQKVIEWTVATTVVFGTLAAVTKQTQQIIELDKNLRRFAITA